MDGVTVVDITRAGPCEDMASYEPQELPPAAGRLFGEILRMGEDS